MLLNEVLFAQTLNEVVDKNLTSPDGSIKMEIDLSLWSRSEAIISLVVLGDADGAEARKQILRNKQWIKQTTQSTLRKFGWEITDEMLNQKLRDDNGQAWLRFFFGMKFAEVDADGKETKNNNIDTDYFLDPQGALVYIKGDDRKRLLSMKVGDVESFTGVSFDTITVKRIV